MNDADFKAMTKEVLTKELEDPIQWHYFSFADKKFNGAVVIECHGILDGLSRINMLGINPGGEVLCAPIIGADNIPSDKYRNRLLTRYDIREFWPDAKSLREWEQEEESEKENKS